MLCTAPQRRYWCNALGSRGVQTIQGLWGAHPAEGQTPRTHVAEACNPFSGHTRLLGRKVQQRASDTEDGTVLGNTLLQSVA